MTEIPSTDAIDASSTETEAASFEFDQFIAEAEQKIEDLKTRRASIETRKQHYIKLKVDPETLKDIELSADITEQIEQAEYGLFQELVDLVGEEHLGWKKTGESFWTFFRYGGIGFVIAVVLHRLIN